MGIFGPPNIEKLKAAKNFKGLIGALKHKYSSVRKEAIEALADIGKPAVEPLIGALEGKDYEIQHGAAEALGRIGDERAIEPLIKAFKDGMSLVRSKAVGALSKFRDTRAVETIIKALKDNYSDVQINAAWSLAALKDTMAVEPLIENLKHRDREVRKAAAYALGEIGDSRAVEPLIEAIKANKANSVYWVFGASDALTKIIGRKAVTSLNKALKAASSLKKALKEKDREVKREVHEMKKKEIRCSKCGKIIGQLATSIAEDIRRGGGVIIGGGGSLDTPMYQCTICESCGSVFCDICQKPSPDPCPKCGKSNLKPGFADLIQKYYKF